MKPELLVDCDCATGENPLWHPDEQKVYWVDIPAGRIYRYDPAAGTHEMFETGAAVGGFTLQADGTLLLFMARGSVKLWREKIVATTIPELPGELGNRFNDVIADPAGRVFCGVMSTPERAGRLYRLDTDASITCLLEGIGTSNGIGFTPDRRQMYYTDTRKHDIYLFDYDQATGAIENRRTFVHVDEGESRPDGMTVDAEGCVWSARWSGYCVVRYDPAGKEMLRIELPAQNVSSVTFGGQAYEDLYVTTASNGNRPATGEKAGSLYRLHPGARGVPEFRSQVACPPIEKT